MSYAYTLPSRQGVDGRKAGKCISLVTGETVTRATLSLNYGGKKASATRKGGK